MVGVRNCCCVMSSHTPYLGPGVATRKVRGAAVWQKKDSFSEKRPCFVAFFLACEFDLGGYDQLL